MANQTLLNLDGKAVEEQAVESLRALLRGPLIRPGDASYDDARKLWNGMIDRHPGLIARCAGAADVIAAVNFAREQHLLVSVRGGGHNVPGVSVCDGGLVIDTSQMKGIRVDPAGKTVRAQPGLRWGEFDRETQAFGLATTGGTNTDTGIAGLSLGGGIGWLGGKHGMTVDNILSVDIVTADGRLRTASATENPDLYWAIRGGGGNFGVTTRFHFQLHQVETVVGGMLLLPATPAVITSFIAEATAASDELSTIANIMPAPPMPFVPTEHHGQLVIMALMAYAGEYHSDELDASYTVVLTLEGGLAVLRKRVDPVPLTAVTRDKFSGRSLGSTVTFVRAPSGDVTGLTLAGATPRRLSLTKVGSVR